MARNRVIGKNNTLPWRMPADLQHFKAITMGKPVVMGRKTYESIGRPLPGRTNIIISRNIDYHADGCTTLPSLDEAITLLENTHDELMIIGGGSFYEQTLPYAERLYLTLLDADIAGDAYFPDFNINEWQETASEAHNADDKNDYDYRFVTLDKILNKT